MIERQRRRFTISDLMLLVGASALATLMTREYTASVFVVYPRPSAQRLFELIEGATTCVTASLMLALIPIRRARPRPPLRRLARQPGFVASCALTAILVTGFLRGSMRIAFIDGPKYWGGHWPFQQLFEWNVAFPGPFAVGAAWLLLALAGRWRPEASWVDRVGRAAGALWVAWLPCHLVEPWLLRYVPSI